MLPESTTPEEWRPVVGYEEVYSVSSLGRVRRERAYHTTWAGRVLRTYLCAGYHRLMLSLNNQKRQYFVHQLVAVAFLGPYPPGQMVNHKDGVKLNNRPENLEYCTPRENMEHASRLGLMATGDRNAARLYPETRARGDQHGSRLHPERMARGERNGSRLYPDRLPRGEAQHLAKLTAERVIAMRAERTAGATYQQLGERYGVSPQTAWRACQRKTWHHIP